MLRLRVWMLMCPNFLVFGSAEILLCPADLAWQEGQQFTLTLTASVFEMLPLSTLW
jgi:hypothetical protein